ncbi:MAG: tail fiber protein [Pseudomonadota bacterium]|nr:tail fiber protein [Pseudomonadota bacterium]MEC8482483.1 tail fiber protein [Pseudomonadota bacterium]
MSEPFIGEIRMTAINFAPKGWAFCDGQLLAISQNQSLFYLLGTQFGGDGRTNFALPDFRGRAPIGAGSNRFDHSFTYEVGDKGGESDVTLTINQLPKHTHLFVGSNDAAKLNPPRDNSLLATSQQDTELYGPATSLTTLAPQTSSNTGGGGSHNNMQPSAVVNFIIALTGIFPSRN